MPWAKIDDSSLDHEKFVALLDLLTPIEALAADGLWRRGLTYAAKHLTDGYLQRAVIPQLAPRLPLKVAYRLADALVDARGRSEYGLWLSVDGGYQIHDYDAWNRSREAVEQGRSAKAEAGRLGGRRSGEARRQARASRSNEAQAQAPASSNGEAPASHLVDVLPNSRTRTYNPPIVPGSKTEAPASNRPAHACTHGPSCPEASKPLDADGLTACTGPEGQPLYTWPTPAAKAQRGWLPGSWPFAGVHLDCPDPAWRGRCVDRAYVAAHPERRWYPSAGNGVPRSCPAHQEAPREP